MIGKFTIVATVSALTLSATAFAQGTADQTKDMLTKATAAVKADKAKALDQFNKGEGGFLQGDLYVFCFNAGDAKIIALANPNAKQLIGTDVRDLKDSTGHEYGKALMASSNKPEGELTVTDYLFPKPGADKTPVQKESFTTKVSDLVCGVGYYK